MGFCRCVYNAKRGPVDALFEGGAHTTWIPYFALLGKCKNFDQWKARMLAVGCPRELVTSVRSVNDCGRSLAMKFIADKGTDPVSVELRSNVDLVSEAAAQYLA